MPCDGIDWREGVLPQIVNESAKKMMADIAEWRDNLHKKPSRKRRAKK